jgi:hypothetical protein
VTLLDEARRKERRRAAERNGAAHHPVGAPPPPKETGGPEPAPSVETFTAVDLLAAELPEPRMAVEGLIPEGLTVLAGKPKLGKSWMCFSLALAVATGGRALGRLRVEPGEVLYLALEDTKRRLKSRLEKLLGTDSPPAGLHFARNWPRMDKMGGSGLIDWLDAHPACKLVIIDTWPKFKPVRIGKGNDYEIDYKDGGELKALADAKGIAIVVVCHCRKMPATDPLEEVTGTMGLTGAADATLVLRRERGQHDAALFVTGRDLDEQELALSWDAPSACWSIVGEASEYRISKERAEVIDLLTREGRPMTPREATPLLQKKYDAVRFLFWSMAKDGLLLALGRGLYTTTSAANSASAANSTSAASASASRRRESTNGFTSADDEYKDPFPEDFR